MKSSKRKVKSPSQDHQIARAAPVSWDKTRHYPTSEAVDLLKKSRHRRFDQTIELHLTVAEKNIRQTVVLPHGTGKSANILVFTTNAQAAEASKSAGATMVGGKELVSKIQKSGLRDVDMALATPEMMPLLVPIAKILGPKGLMPNPKAGTITSNPQDYLASRSKGTIDIKTEKDQPLAHIVVGKISMEAKDIQENIQAIFSALSGKILKATLCGTMTPGIKLLH